MKFEFPCLLSVVVADLTGQGVSTFKWISLLLFSLFPFIFNFHFAEILSVVLKVGNSCWFRHSPHVAFSHAAQPRTIFFLHLSGWRRNVSDKPALTAVRRRRERWRRKRRRSWIQKLPRWWVLVALVQRRRTSGTYIWQCLLTLFSSPTFHLAVKETAILSVTSDQHFGSLWIFWVCFMQNLIFVHSYQGQIRCHDLTRLLPHWCAPLQLQLVTLAHILSSLLYIQCTCQGFCGATVP